MDCIRDRRTRYLGAGLTQKRDRVGNPDAPASPETTTGPVSSDEELKEFIAPIESDLYYVYEREGGKIVKIDDYDQYVAKYRNTESTEG